MTESKGAPVGISRPHNSMKAETDAEKLPERKKWDKGEWEAKAKEKDKLYADRAKEAEAAMKEGTFSVVHSTSCYRPVPMTVGRKPRFQDVNDKPRPKREMEDRNTLDLNRNVGKTQLVQTTTSGKGPKGPGFYVSTLRLTCSCLL